MSTQATAREQVPAVQLSQAALQAVDTCVHCGLCLPSCPTYKELGNEADSPRGRIYLMKLAHEGRIGLSGALVAHLDLCLDCRNCETVCPSGVKYGTIIEDMRHQIAAKVPRPWWAHLLRNLLLHSVLPNPRRLELLAGLLRFAQRSGLNALARRLGLMKLLPGHLGDLEPMLPPVPPRSSRRVLPTNSPAHGEGRLRAGFLLGCVMDVLLPATNQACVRTLNRSGMAVACPQGQACCGALHAHGGDLETARALARKNIAAFDAAGVDVVVVNAAGCGAHMKGFGRLLADDPHWAERAQGFAARVKDYSEVLAELGALPVVGSPLQETERVAYQDACHLAHGQGIRKQPRQVLAALGVSLTDVAEPEACCGSAGFYNLVEYEMSMRVLDRKMGHIKRSGARVVVTGNPGCLLQLRLGARRHNLDLEVLHLGDFVDRLQSQEWREQDG